MSLTDPFSNPSSPDTPAKSRDFPGRFREIISDPLNLFIERAPTAGVVEDGMVTLHNGLKVPLTGKQSYYGDFSQILVINRGVHEPLEEFVFQEMLRVLPKRPVMLELGAYWGHYSMWLKTVRPRARTILVEPSWEGLRAGQLNYERNGMEGEFVQAKVGRGELEVDTFLEERGLERLDILHCDIQGAEVEMLEGAERFLSRHGADYIFVSTHSQELHQGVRDGLTRHGYRVEASSDFAFESTAFDGLVFATSPSVPPLLPDFQPLGREEIVHSRAGALVGYVKALSASRKR